MKSIDYLRTYADKGELYIGGLYPCTDCNLTIDLGIDRSWQSSEFTLHNSVTFINIQRRGDNTYRVISIWTNDTGNQQSSMFDISPPLITNNRIKLNLLSYNANRTNIIKFSDNLQMSTPYEKISSRNLPYPVLIQPTLQCEMVVSNHDGNSGWERVHIYNITQTIDRQTVTAYSTKNQTGFGLDAPVLSKDTNGTTYMQGKGQEGTVWAYVKSIDPATVAYQKMLLSQGWELGIYFSQELANLPLQQAQALMDSEYSNISSTFGQPPTSFCCLRNNDNISHAIYAYQQYGMFWRNGPSGISWITNVGNLANSTWGWWDSASLNNVVYPSFTRELDPEPAIISSIDYNKFTTFSNRYYNAGINLVGFTEYYKRGIAQNTTTINLEESNVNHIKFIPTTNGYPCVINVKTSMAKPQVYANGVAITFTQTSDGVVFTANNSTEYVVASSTLIPVSNFTSNVTSGDAPLTVQFSDLSTQSPTAWNWDFGDGANSTLQNPVHTYSAAGNCTVTLKVTNAVGNNTTTKPNYIQVAVATQKPVANFSNNLTQGYAPLSVQFNDSSENATGWKWDFGDNSPVLNDQNPVHVYDGVGSYNVSLTVWNDNGQDTKTIEDCIRVESDPSIKFVLKCPVDMEVMDPDGLMISKQTNEIPGAVYKETDINNDGSPDDIVLIPFIKSGDYKAKVVPEPDVQITDTDTYTLEVSSADNHVVLAKDVLVRDNPQVEYVVPSKVLDSTPPSSILDLQSTAGTTWINWTWRNPNDPDFNHSEIYLKGIFQTNTSAEYFNATGLHPETSYTLSTRTVDNYGNVNQKWVNSTAKTSREFVPIIPIANFTSNVTQGYAPLDVQFNDSSQNTTGVSWDFDNNGIIDSTERSPIHEYATPGIYTVNLTAANANGTNSKLATVVVSEKPVGFLNKVTLGDMSPVSPALASFKGRLYLAWKDSGNNNLNVMYSTDDGKTFGNKYTSPETSPESPAICVHKGNLYIAWKGNGNNKLNVAQVTMNGDKITGLSNKVTLGDTSPVSPALSSFKGRLYLAWKGNGNNNLNVMYSTDGGKTFGNKYTSRETSPESPALCAHNSHLYIAWKGDGNNKLNVAQVI